MSPTRNGYYFESSLANIKKEDWDLCLNDDHPFTQYEFLLALEKSKSACLKTGWQPYHYVEYEKNKKISAICPLYIKNHSFGEYIFDQAWADAYTRHGLNYYPKLQSAIPFTPVTGERIFINNNSKNINKKKSDVISNIITEVKKINVSSLHFNFISNSKYWNNNELKIREGIQFHWKNYNYNSFDDFLKTLSSRKRKQIKKERLCLEKNDLNVKFLHGNEIKEDHMNFFYDCYTDTTSRKWGSAYLTKDFFFQILKNFKDKILLIIAFQNNNKIASAINFISKTHLYGRLWGAKKEIPYLHFELCYYQAIEYAIKNNIQIVEAGAQGEHKLQRGYMPEKTWSAHYIKNQEFSLAIEKFLNHETEAVSKYKKNLEEFAPYKN